MEQVNTIIFSKDRAAQLDALLRSIAEKVERWRERGQCTVIYTASTPEFARGYEIVRAAHPQGVEFINETGGPGFKPLVERAMARQRAANNARLCMFLVDDIIFKSAWSADGGKPLARLLGDPRVLCLSLRMCHRYDFCYAKNKPQKVPFWSRFGRWKWIGARGDWGYPMSVDGHIFRYEDMLPLVERLDFRHPNSFEAALAGNAIKTRPLMTCYREAVIVNLPVNRVQDDFKNRAGEQHGISAEDLNRLFLEGKRVDLAPVYALNDNRGCHHEMPMRLV